MAVGIEASGKKGGADRVRNASDVLTCAALGLKSFSIIILNIFTTGQIVGSKNVTY